MNTERKIERGNSPANAEGAHADRICDWRSEIHDLVFNRFVLSADLGQGEEGRRKPVSPETVAEVLMPELAARLLVDPETIEAAVLETARRLLDPALGPCGLEDPAALSVLTDHYNARFVHEGRHLPRTAETNRNNMGEGPCHRKP
jgi:hypothetical protein